MLLWIFFWEKLVRVHMRVCVSKYIHVCVCVCMHMHTYPFFMYIIVCVCVSICILCSLIIAFVIGTVPLDRVRSTNLR